MKSESLNHTIFTTALACQKSNLIVVVIHLANAIGSILVYYLLLYPVLL